ncbi:uncharacterized protein LOC131852291 [Achroia grisella]|uniref:uncharacterized protein LOC131852291 n=1 Tax=Achroia grisella TaxID=688607 RepID=UPI0027D29F17|nr:uncharacterized protein LOC131852291 [Achroia grisella]XP_059058950.1 uncharacterized protein LOC131852291 [Achroia grisella]
MAPVKFGLFKTRSREQEQPSTENLLNISTEHVASPSSPIPSTSKGIVEDLIPADISDLHLDSEDDDEVISEKPTPTRFSERSQSEDGQFNYLPLKNPTDSTSITTLQQEDLDDIHNYDLDSLDGASTSCDVNSLQFDETSIAPSEDISVYCGALKKPKKSRSKEEQQMRDVDMWKASDVEVMRNLLNRSGTLDEKIKWEAIATARGLCTLTDSCTCGDCTRAKYLAGVTDGDGGIGAAPLFNAISVGCQVQ